MIRQATIEDSRGILELYSYYIENTPISFEIETPSQEDFQKRVDNIISAYPYLVYTDHDEIVGYAYASKHRERAAYQYSIDVSVYVKPGVHSQGVGTRLYNQLFEILENYNYYSAYAGITIPNERSINLHRKFGFEQAGIFHNVGYKFNQWYDVVWLEKKLKNYTI